MTPTLLAALVACLAVIAWQRSSLRTARERGEAIAANAATERATARKRAETERVTARKRAEVDARLLADAWALLHDDKRRGKALNHAAWLVARSEWCQRWRGEA